MATSTSPSSFSSSSSSDGDSSNNIISSPSITTSTILSPIKPLAILSSPNSGPISSLSLASPDHLLSSSDHHLLLWHNLLPTPIISSLRTAASIKSLTIAGNNLLITAHQDSRIRLWKLQYSPSSSSNTTFFKLTATLPTKSDILNNFLFKHNTSYVQTRRHHRKLWIEHADTISSLAVADNNQTLYSGSWDKTIKVWSLTDLKCVESIKAHDDAINALAVCNGVVYSASADGKIKMWSVSDNNNNKKKKKQIYCLKGCLELGAGCERKLGSGGVCWNALVVCDNGKLVYGAGSDGRVVGWDEEGRVVCDVRAHERAGVLCLCVVGGGEYVCSGAGDGSVGVWRRGDGGGELWRRVGMVQGHQGPVKCLEASERGENIGGFVLYSGGVDGCVRVWWVAKEEMGVHGEKMCVI